MDKLERKLLYLDNLLSKQKELQKKVAIAQREVAYLKQIDEILRQSDADVLVSTTDYRSGVRSEDPRPVPSFPESPSAPSPEPKRPVVASPWGPCSSWGTDGQIYHTIRALSTGRRVPLLVCGECKAEQIAAGM